MSTTIDVLVQYKKSKALTALGLEAHAGVVQLMTVPVSADKDVKPFWKREGWPSHLRVIAQGEDAVEKAAEYDAKMLLEMIKAENEAELTADEDTKILFSEDLALEESYVDKETEMLMLPARDKFQFSSALMQMLEKKKKK